MDVSFRKGSSFLLRKELKTSIFNETPSSVASYYTSLYQARLSQISKINVFHNFISFLFGNEGFKYLHSTINTSKSFNSAHKEYVNYLKLIKEVISDEGAIYSESINIYNIISPLIEKGFTNSYICNSVSSSLAKKYGEINKLLLRDLIDSIKLLHILKKNLINEHVGHFDKSNESTINDFFDSSFRESSSQNTSSSNDFQNPSSSIREILLSLDPNFDSFSNEKINSVVNIISSSKSNASIEEELFYQLGDSNFNLALLLLSNRDSIISKILSDGLLTLRTKEIDSNMALKTTKLPKIVLYSTSISDAQSANSNNSKSALSSFLLNPTVTSLPNVSSLKSILPIGSSHSYHKGYEEVYVPPRSDSSIDLHSGLLSLHDSDDSFLQRVFSDIDSFNFIQSRCFDTSYNSNQNMLLCAPTGSGKTLVAMQVIARELKSHLNELSAPISRGYVTSFKIVYVAPMKALAQEIVNHFTKRLSKLNVVIRECTGDQQLTKMELATCHIIVTTPEKYDVITRKSNDSDLVSRLKVLIIDEIHLLNDDRGAVIESIVARTLRFVESSQSMIRIVGLSATLPNTEDISTFLRVNPGGLFVFSNQYRPIPLSQYFIGITDYGSPNSLSIMNRVCYEKLISSIRNNHQAIVFVHSRRDTVRLIQWFLEQDDIDIFLRDLDMYPNIQSSINASRHFELKSFIAKGFGCHHAGMIRSDRSLVERLFREGFLSVIVSTATLAWGVNLPAHTVIIRGTKIYNVQKGGFYDLDILDVLQIFGRAGRPQYDTLGEGIIITSQSSLYHYVRSLNHQLPIESKLMNSLSDHLSAEIVSNSIVNIDDGVRWLRYTYLFTRIAKNPTHYGVSLDDQLKDPDMASHRRLLIVDAAEKLYKYKMIRYDPKLGNVYPTGLGRIASYYYIRSATIERFNDTLTPYMTNPQILNTISSASEFENIQIREEEMNELDRLATLCPVEVLLGVENVGGKANVLIQSSISRRKVDSFTLLSDQLYIMQSAGRIARSLFEIGLLRGWPTLANRLLKIAKMIDSQIWDFQTPLRQFKTFSNLLAYKIEEKKMSLEKLKEMEANDLSNILMISKREADHIKELAHSIPSLSIETRIRPLTHSVLRIELSITANFKWNDRVHGGNEPFYLWLEDSDNEHIYHHESFNLFKKDYHYSHPVNFTVPIFEAQPTHYIVRLVSDKWLGSESEAILSLIDLNLPVYQPQHTTLLPLQPLPISALMNNEFEKLLSFTHFNPIQTQIFHTAYHTDENILLGAPTGSGKTVVAEIAILRLFKEHPNMKVVYIAPLKALTRERVREWTESFQKHLNFKIIELTGDFTPDIYDISQSSIIITTPEKWDGISRMWLKRFYVQSVGLVIIDEIHLLGNERGAILEVIVSRMRYIATHTKNPIRMIGLSTALANVEDLADWLGVKKGLFNFPSSIRPVPLSIHISGYPGRHYCPRMATMNKPTYNAICTHSFSSPTLVFVASRRQTRLTALELVKYCAIDSNPKKFLLCCESEIALLVEPITDSTLKYLLTFGVGIHHAGLRREDRSLTEYLFLHSKIQVLVCTATLAWGINLPAHLVVIKGTEYYDGKTHSYIDFPITDILQMVGRAGRPQFDTNGVASVLVHEPKKDFYRKFLYSPFPVESTLSKSLHEHFMAEVVAGTIMNLSDAIDYLSWTYFFRRLLKNPNYYDLDINVNETSPSLQDHNDEAIILYLKNMIERIVADLIEGGCLAVSNNSYLPTSLGSIFSFYYLKWKTAARFNTKLKKNMSLIELFKLFFSAAEYEELPVRHNEDVLNEKLALLCPLNLSTDAYDDPNIKANLLMEAHLSDLELPSTDYLTDTLSILDNTIRIANALIDISAEKGLYSTTHRVVNLLQMFTSGRWFDSALLAIPGMTPSLSTLLLSDDITSIAELIHMNISSLRGYARSASYSESEIKLLKSSLNKYPDIEIRVEKPLIISEGEKIKLPIHLKRKNKWIKDSHFRLPAAFVPKWPKRIREGWILIIFDPSTDELIRLKRFSFKREHDIDFSFPFKRKVGILLLSEVYMGLDQLYYSSIVP